MKDYLPVAIAIMVLTLGYFGITYQSVMVKTPDIVPMVTPTPASPDASQGGPTPTRQPSIVRPRIRAGGEGD